MINAGKYKHRIKILQVTTKKDAAGFPVRTENTILSPYAAVRTLRGYTMIKNGTDFEKAYTNFTIRYPKTVITRDMIIEFKEKRYSIEYLNDVDEENVELEIQAKEITH